MKHKTILLLLLVLFGGQSVLFAGEDDTLDTSSLPPAMFRNVLTGESFTTSGGHNLPLQNVLRGFPVALLASL